MRTQARSTPAPTAARSAPAEPSAPRAPGVVRRSRLAIALVSALVLLVACSSDGDGTATGSGGSTPADASTPDRAPTNLADGAPVPSAGCGTSTVRDVLHEKVFLDDSDRWWLLATPPDHDGETPLPLVLDFHGLMEGADVHRRMTGLGEFAQANGFVAVFPHGTGTPIHWEVGPNVETNPDLQYVVAMLDQLEAELCIDTARVYATGLSNGAFMTSALACTMSDRFAAVAPVAGVTYPDVCASERAVPMLSFHGTDDPILLFNGGVDLGNLPGSPDEVPITAPGEDPSTTEIDEPTTTEPGAGEGEAVEADIDGEGYPKAMRQWADHNGCEPEPIDEELTPTVLARTWDCPAGADTKFLVIQGGGHTWPGSEFSDNPALEEIMGVTDQSIDANELMWAFFQRFTLPAE